MFNNEVGEISAMRLVADAFVRKPFPMKESVRRPLRLRVRCC